MRIDAHTHGMHAERDDKGEFVPPMMAAWNSETGAPQEFVKQYNERGIEKIFILDPVDIAFELKETFGDFVVPIPCINMDKTSPEDIDAIFARGARGIKFIAPMHSYGDNRYFPLYNALNNHKGLAVFHTGYLTKELFGPDTVLPRDDYVDITHMRPAALDRIARAFPDLKILMSHFGNPWWEEAWTVLKSNKNIYADLSGGTAKRKDMSVWRNLFAPSGKLHEASVSKLCFASDGGYFVEDQFGFMNDIEFFERFYEALKVPVQIQRMIERENAMALISASSI